MVQALVAAPMEAGLFYVRRPGAERGRLVGLTVRHTPCVVGDGRRSVQALIAVDGRLRGHSGVYARALGSDGLAAVPGAGERVMLTTVASLRVGARYEDRTDAVTSVLDDRVDAIARSMPDFHLGRFDVRFDTMAALGRGEFRIIEVNGAGSEAIHLWDPAISLWAAFAGVFAKQRLLFQLGAAMRARGHAPVGVVGLVRAWWRQQGLIARYPDSN